MNEYTGFAAVYDLFMDNVPYKEWAEKITAILNAHGIKDGLVLDLGCGTGTMTEYLAVEGYDMIGVDNSNDMLAVAMDKKSESGYDILYLKQDLTQFELYGTVRAIVSICDTLNYILKIEDLLTVFKLVNNYLDDDGLFIFDMNTTYKYENELADNVFAENRDNASFIWENSYNNKMRINEYVMTFYVKGDDNKYERFEEIHNQKAYESEEIEEMLKTAGLQVLNRDLTSDRMFYTVRKNK